MHLGNTGVQVLADLYRVPHDLLGRVCIPQPSGKSGFFRFGPEIICYGQCKSGVSQKIEDAGLFDAFEHVRSEGAEICLPFDPSQVIDNLHRERYLQCLVPARERIVIREKLLRAYYVVRKLLPAALRRRLQRAYFSDWKDRPFPAWPVDVTADKLQRECLRLRMRAAGLQRVPFIWFWPDGAPNCLILTHDVETTAGRDFAPRLMDVDDRYQFKASFQVVPEERYEVGDEFIGEIRNRGFEFNVHDLNHDGRLYREREEFLRRAKKINEYVHRYRSRGFRAGAMHRNADWYDAFEFSYDMSLSSVAHLEPKRGGCCTVFPFFIGKILELPLTTSQDYSLFHIFKDYSIGVWKEQIDLIRRGNGLISFIAHPDYLVDPRARKVYESLLEFLRQMVTSERIWAALPGDVDQWWRTRNQLRLVPKGTAEWEIQGPGRERACIAYAVLEGDGLRYEVAGTRVHESTHS